MKTRYFCLVCVILAITGACFTSGCCSTNRKSNEMSLVFDSSEAEFRELSNLLTIPMSDEAKVIVRERLVFCVMLMQHCVDADTVVVREAPHDGFETRKVTQDWIQKYIDQVSKYQEWEKRQNLMMGVLVKVSG